MTVHDHRVFVEGCYRCDLDRDEAYADSDLVRETAAKIAEENSDLMDRLAAVTQSAGAHERKPHERVG